jgi:hypothetical protein
LDLGPSAIGREGTLGVSLNPPREVVGSPLGGGLAELKSGRPGGGRDPHGGPKLQPIHNVTLNSFKPYPSELVKVICEELDFKPHVMSAGDVCSPGNL